MPLSVLLENFNVFFVCIIWNYCATLSLSLCIASFGEDPDELEVYGTDTTTGPLLTSYKFEVQSCSVYVCLGWILHFVLCGLSVWIGTVVIVKTGERNNGCCDKFPISFCFYISICICESFCVVCVEFLSLPPSLPLSLSPSLSPSIPLSLALSLYPSLPCSIPPSLSPSLPPSLPLSLPPSGM